MLALKLGLAPLLIAAVSLAGQRFGATVAGVLAGFPIIAGPIFVILTLEHGATFGTEAAIATLAGVGSFAAFALGYAWLSRRRSWPPTLLVGWLAYLLIALLLFRLDWSLPTACIVALAALAGSYRLLPRTSAAVATVPLPHGEMMLRMLAGAALVVAVTALARTSGPRLTGLFTPFPVAGSVLAACSHRVAGSDAAVRLLRGMLGGLASLVAFFAVAALLLSSRGLPLATATGLMAAVTIQGLLLRLHSRPLPPARIDR